MDSESWTVPSDNACTPANQEGVQNMKRWVKPKFINRRFGFEINLYINNR